MLIKLVEDFMSHLTSESLSLSVGYKSKTVNYTFEEISAVLIVQGVQQITPI